MTTQITMKSARAKYRELFMTPLTFSSADGQIVTLVGVSIRKPGAPSFRTWARSHGVWFDASHKHPVGKLARIMGRS